jgi:peptidyl-prolyl cis-trans isomerase D
MLQVIRSKATSFVIKILFGLLILSFGIWGIGDIFRNRGTNTSVATVGDRTISVEQLNERVRADMERLRTAMGGNLDMDQAKQLGIVDRALQTIINGDLLDQETDRLKLGISDATVRQAILENPNFHNDQGQFDRGIYTRVLAASRMSEPQFETLLRRDIARFHLSAALTDGLTPPPALVDALYRAQAERRVADVIVLPPSAAGTINPPSDDELKAYYEQHQDQFRAPERRASASTTWPPASTCRRTSSRASTRRARRSTTRPSSAR